MGLLQAESPQVVEAIRHVNRQIATQEEVEFPFADIYCHARRSTTQSVANVTWENLEWDTQISDTDGMFTPTTGVMYVNTPGFYIWGGAAHFTTSTQSQHILAWASIGGSGRWSAANFHHATSDRAWSMSVAAGSWFDAGDSARIYVYHNRGSANDVQAAGATTFDHNSGWMARIG